MAQDPTRITADKTLTRDIEKATTPDEIRELLHAAVQRSGIADRDPQTGQFIPRAPAAQVAEPEERVYSKTVTIAGRDFTFTDSSEAGLTNQIASAQVVAENLQESQETPTPRGQRFSATERAQQLLDNEAKKIELDALLRAGLITSQQYLESTGAIDQYLANRGVDVEKIAGQQFESDWSSATSQFLNSEAGRDWPGGDRNLQVIGTTLAAMGLTDSPSVESLAKAWQEMKAKGTIFHDTSDEQLLDATKEMTPQQIIENWKQTHAGEDPEQANASFIETFRGGRLGGSSSVFGK